MAIISVPRSDTLEEFRQKFNQLSENVGDGAGILGDSPLSSVVEHIVSIQAEVDQLQLDLGDLSQLETGLPMESVVEALNSFYVVLNDLQAELGQKIEMLVLPFYDSNSQRKDIPVYLNQL